MLLFSAQYPLLALKPSPCPLPTLSTTRLSVLKRFFICSPCGVPTDGLGEDIVNAVESVLLSN